MKKVALLLLFVAACRGSSGSAPADAAAPDAAAAPPGQAEELVGMAVPGHLDAVVAMPENGQAEPRPLLVATHGAWDRPDWHCALWRRITRARAFVLCPRGEPTLADAPPGERLFFYRDDRHLDAEVKAAIVALVARFGDRVDAARPVYAGFSQGAIQGAVMLRANGAGFARAVLVEGGYGGYDEWGPQAAEGFRKGGGERVLLACGREECARTSETTRGFFERAGVLAKILYVPGVGHSYGDGMEAKLAESFAWVTEGDARW